MGTSPHVEEHEKPVEQMSSSAEYLCHKCYIIKKANPTPPPEDGEPRPATSPALPPLITKRPTPATIPSIEEQFRAIDNPPQRQTPVLPPSTPINGMLGHGSNGPYGPPHHVYPQAFHQPNGYHQPPPAASMGGMHMHERQNSYGNYAYHQPRPSPIPPAPHYGPSFAQSHPRPPLNGFAPPGQNPGSGLRSPHLGQPSPNYPPPSQHHQQMSSLSRDGSYPGQLPSLGPPVHSNPHSLFGRPGSQSQHAPQPQHPPPHHPQNPMNAPAHQQQAQQQSQQQHQSQPVQPAQQSQQNPATPSVLQTQPQHTVEQPTQNQQSTAASPQQSSVRLEGGDAPRPTTPRGGQVNGTTGASASPNLANLLH